MEYNVILEPVAVDDLNDIISYISQTLHETQIAKK